MKNKWKWIILIIVLFLFTIPLIGLWNASNQLLFPVWRGVTKDLGDCKEETAKYWGAGCGNLRITNEFKFEEVKIQSSEGYKLPGWLVKASENGTKSQNGVMMLIHGGGSDRREMTKFLRFFISQDLDILLFDLSCHGEAPCLKPGLTYGERESKDVLAGYQYLLEKYQIIYAMGSSVGAASILIALPKMPKLSGVVVENPMYNFERLIREFPGTKDSVPGWFNTLLIRLTMLRAGFNGTESPAISLSLVKNPKILFIHSKNDSTVSYLHSEELASLYPGQKSVWISSKGNHGSIWDADKDEYKKRLSDFLKGDLK
jgi:uncharacterized protein